MTPYSSNASRVVDEKSARPGNSNGHPIRRLRAEAPRVVPALAPHIEELTSEAHHAWDAYVAGHPDANVYHLRAWKTAAERAYGLRTPFVVARDAASGRVCGALPLFIAGGPLHRYAVTGPFGAYGRVLADSPAVVTMLLDAARNVAERFGARHLTWKALDPKPLLAPAGFVRDDSCVIATLALPSDPEVLWHSFRAKLRNAVRKAQRSGLELRVGREHLEAFYDVLAENMHRKGTPIYGLPFIRELVDEMGPAQSQIYTLWKDGKAVSGALELHYKGVSYQPFVSSRKAYFHLNPNNLIYWEMMRASCLRGDHLFDFGRSVRDSSNLAFKTHFSATVEENPYYVSAFRGRPPATTVTSTVERLARAWSWVPRPIADIVGPAICGRFLT